MTPSPTTNPPPAFGERLRRWGQRALLLQSFFGLIGVLALSIMFSPIRDDRIVFLAPGNLLNIVRFASENGIIAVGMTLVILTGGIDLSVGALLALCAVAAAAGLSKYHLGAFPTILMVLGLGAAAGFLNGLITTRLRIQSFIATLAMLSVARGAASLWSGGYAIPLSFGSGAGMAPPLFKSLFAGEVSLFGLAAPTQLFYFAAVSLIASVALQRTHFGRRVYAVGSSEAASRLSGVSVDWVKTAVFALSGLLVGLAALLHVALVNQGSHIDGSGYELNAIAAVVIGGTSLAGGSGTVLGTVIGALILSVLDNILGLRNVQSEYQLILKGFIIVLAVVLQRRR